MFLIFTCFVSFAHKKIFELPGNVKLVYIKAGEFIMVQGYYSILHSIRKKAVIDFQPKRNGNMPAGQAQTLPIFGATK